MVKTTIKKDVTFILKNVQDLKEKVLRSKRKRVLDHALKNNINNIEAELNDILGLLSVDNSFINKLKIYDVYILKNKTSYEPEIYFRDIDQYNINENNIEYYQDYDEDGEFDPIIGNFKISDIKSIKENFIELK